MLFIRSISKPVAAITAACFFAVTGPLPVAQAAMIGTERIVSQQELTDARANLDAFFSRNDVREQMEALGVSADEAKARVAGMTDEEVTRVASRLDSLPAGQGAVGVLVGAAVIIIIVLLITDIFGVTDVFPFINKNNVRR